MELFYLNASFLIPMINLKNNQPISKNNNRRKRVLHPVQLPTLLKLFHKPAGLKSTYQNQTGTDRKHDPEKSVIPSIITEIQVFKNSRLLEIRRQT